MKSSKIHHYQIQRYKTGDHANHNKEIVYEFCSLDYHNSIKQVDKDFDDIVKGLNDSAEIYVDSFELMASPVGGEFNKDTLHHTVKMKQSILLSDLKNYLPHKNLKEFADMKNKSHVNRGVFFYVKTNTYFSEGWNYYSSTRTTEYYPTDEIKQKVLDRSSAALKGMITRHRNKMRTIEDDDRITKQIAKIAASIIKYKESLSRSTKEVPTAWGISEEMISLMVKRENDE